MKKNLGFCGLDCASCPAYLATQKNDFDALTKVAQDWTKEYGHEVKTADVICDGCVVNSTRKGSYCATCEIRVCSSQKGLENCASCSEYLCPKLEDFLTHAPSARENLEALRIKH